MFFLLHMHTMIGRSLLPFFLVSSRTVVQTPNKFLCFADFYLHLWLACAAPNSIDCELFFSCSSHQEVSLPQSQSQEQCHQVKQGTCGSTGQECCMQERQIYTTKKCLFQKEHRTLLSMMEAVQCNQSTPSHFELFMILCQQIANGCILQWV